MKPGRAASRDARHTGLGAWVVAEIDTIGFWIAYALFVAGVALLSIPFALIAGGILLGAVCALLAIGEGRKAQGRSE